MDKKELVAYEISGTANTSKIDGIVAAATITAIVGQRGDSRPDISVGADDVAYAERTFLGKTETDNSMVSVSAEFSCMALEALKVTRFEVDLCVDRGDEVDVYRRVLENVSLERVSAVVK